MLAAELPDMSLRRLSRACVLLFAVSTAFPVTAGIIPADTMPRWLGYADVGVAGLLVGVALAVTAKSRDRVTDKDRLSAFHLSQMLVSLIPMLLVVFFLAGDRINWQVLIIGVAWRGWLLLYTLPCLIAANEDRLS